MQNKSDLEKLIYKAIDRVNDVLLDENAVPKAPDTVLLGPGAVLDSMGFVNFVVTVEEVVAQETGLNINLSEALNTNNGAISGAVTIAGLADFLSTLMPPQSSDASNT